MRRAYSLPLLLVAIGCTPSRDASGWGADAGELAFADPPSGAAPFTPPPQATPAPTFSSNPAPTVPPIAPLQRFNPVPSLTTQSPGLGAPSVAVPVPPAPSASGSAGPPPFLEAPGSPDVDASAKRPKTPKKTKDAGH